MEHPLRTSKHVACCREPLAYYRKPLAYYPESLICPHQSLPLSGMRLSTSSISPSCFVFSLLWACSSHPSSGASSYALSTTIRSTQSHIIHQLLCIPPFVSFYELTLRRIFPRLPSVFTIVLKLYKNGVLTMGTVTWLVSSLPQSMTSGLSAVGGIAMGGTTALAGVATAFMGGAAAAASAVAGVAGQAASVATGGLNGATNLVDGAAKGIADGIS